MNKLNVVQGARALAAALVVVSHGELWAAGFGPIGLPERDFGLLGSIGVMMFFTISGFIMLHVHHDMFGMRDAPGTFLRRRIARIVPLYWLMTIAAAAIVVKNAQPLGVADMVQSFLFIPSFGALGLMRPVLGVGWTLNYEMFFYALFAAALFLRRGLALLCLTLAALLVFGQIINPVWNYHEPRNAIEFWTTPLLLPFLLGVGFAVARRRVPNLRVHRPALLMACGIAAIAVIQTLLVPVGQSPGWWRVTLPVDSAIVAAFAILAPGTIAVPAWIVLIGDASFSLYLVHPLLFGVAQHLGGVALGRVSPVLALVFYMGLSIVAAVALYFAVERPLTRRCAQFLSGLGRKREAQASAA
ncbi:acyltransferase [Novosphingobium sp. BL-8A]|uniref:acyltransferase family protein n=1 Tax=Novosphingobium sp. BL-8A TaxID=3127639 RepID=UPI00375752A5